MRRALGSSVVKAIRWQSVGLTVKATWAELVALYRLTMDTPPHNLRPRYNVCADCVKWECPATPGILVLQLNIAITTSRNATAPTIAVPARATATRYFCDAACLLRVL
jgi:hypothetical protein